MKNTNFVPLGFFLNTLLSVFLVGSIFGSLTTYLLLYLNSAFVTNQSGSDNVIYHKRKALVVEVEDGDTIAVMLDNEKSYVSYLGIDAPEDEDDGELSYYSKESHERNKTLVEGKEVLLMWDSSKQRVPHRLLAYVFVGDIFVNAEMLRGGFAEVFKSSSKLKAPTHFYSEIFYQLEQEARANQIGLWNIKEKEKWLKKFSSEPKGYIADQVYFHRPDCPEVKKLDNKNKYYFSTRKNAISNHKKPCPICKP